MARAPRLTGASKQLVTDIQVYSDRVPIEQHVRRLQRSVAQKGSRSERDKIRNTLVREASDFFETQGPFRPLSSTQLQQYTKPGSAPDATISFQSAIELFGGADASRFTRGIGKTRADEETIPTEFKTFAIGKTPSATTLTEQTTNIDTSFIPGLQQELDEGIDPRKTATALSAEGVKNWLFSGNPDAEAYKNEVLNIINEKISNFVLFNYLDKEHVGGQGRVPRITFFPAAARTLNISSKTNFDKYISVSPDKSSARYENGQYRARIQFKLSAAADRAIENGALDGTRKIYDRLGPRVSSRFVEYVFRNLGSKKLSIEFFEELLLLARELDPTRPETALVVSTEIPKLAMGVVTKGVKSASSTRESRTKNIQDTISSTQLTDSVRRSLRARMPKGPRRGPALSPNILTNRTGRFINSVYTQVRGDLIQYFYNPIYQVHEDTARNPSRTVEESIRNITQQRVGRQFNLVKGI